MRHVSDQQRRARIGVRHRFAPVRRTTVEAAVEAMTCLHSTEPATVYLSLAARTDADAEQIASALYQQRTIVKQLAMRRTVFTFPRSMLPAAWGSASARVAGQIGPRLTKGVEAAGIARDGAAWLRRQSAAVHEVLSEGPATTAELRERVPGLNARLALAQGTAYAADVAVANRTLTVLAVGGEILRGDNDGGWRSSRPRWTLAEEWLGGRPAPLAADDGYRELVAAWLRTFGPGTEADLVWWLGATKSVVRRALTALRAEEVALDGGTTGWLLPDDEDEQSPAPYAALLPVLDATVMGWKERGFYLGEHADHLFDRNGNAGTTAWWDGRIVGGWHQRPDGEVVVETLDDIGREGEQALQVEAERLTAWLAGDVVGSVYHSPLTRAAMTG